MRAMPSWRKSKVGGLPRCYLSHMTTGQWPNWRVCVAGQNGNMPYSQATFHQAANPSLQRTAFGGR